MIQSNLYKREANTGFLNLAGDEYTNCFQIRQLQLQFLLKKDAERWETKVNKLKQQAHNYQQDLQTLFEHHTNQLKHYLQSKSVEYQEVSSDDENDVVKAKPSPETDTAAEASNCTTIIPANLTACQTAQFDFKAVSLDDLSIISSQTA